MSLRPASARASRSSVSCPRGCDDSSSMRPLMSSAAPPSSPTDSRSICNMPASNLTWALTALRVDAGERRLADVEGERDLAAAARSRHRATAALANAVSASRSSSRGAQIGIERGRAIVRRPRYRRAVPRRSPDRVSPSAARPRTRSLAIVTSPRALNASWLAPDGRSPRPSSHATSMFDVGRFERRGPAEGKALRACP